MENGFGCSSGAGPCVPRASSDFTSSLFKCSTLTLLLRGFFYNVVLFRDSIVYTARLSDNKKIEGTDLYIICELLAA